MKSKKIVKNLLRSLTTHITPRAISLKAKPAGGDIFAYYVAHTLTEEIKMGTKKLLRAFCMIAITAASFGGVCGAARLVPPQNDYSNILIEANKMPQRLASSYIKATDDGVYIMMSYDNITASLFERNSLGMYIIHFNNSMRITAMYYYPWRTVLFFKPINNTEMLLWSGKDGDIRVYDADGNLKKEYLSLASKKYREMIDDGLSAELLR